MAKKQFRILDSTLREGQQAVHPQRPSEAIVFSRSQQLTIAKLLIDFGIDYIEVGSPVASPFAKKTIEEIIDLQRDKTKILVHCRCLKEDIDTALSLKPDGINLFIGTSRHNLAANKRTFRKALAMAEDSIFYIRKNNNKIIVRLSAEDIFRTSRRDLVRFINANKDLVDRIGLPDTTGVATPEEVFEIFDTVEKITEGKVELEFHGHNDRGLALSNCREAWRGGATVFDTTILGLGERNGIASLSGLIAAIYDDFLAKKYKLKLLQKIDKKLAKIIGISVPHNMPITAPGAFSHVAGVHVSAMSRNKKAYQILRPGIFGRKTRLNIASSVIGKASVLNEAKRNNIKITEEQAQKIAADIRENAKTSGRISPTLINTFVSNLGKN